MKLARPSHIPASREQAERNRPHAGQAVQLESRVSNQRCSHDPRVAAVLRPSTGVLAKPRRAKAGRQGNMARLSNQQVWAGCGLANPDRPAAKSTQAQRLAFRTVIPPPRGRTVSHHLPTIRAAGEDLGNLPLNVRAGDPAKRHEGRHLYGETLDDPLIGCVRL